MAEELCGVKFTGYTGRSVFTCVLPKDHVGDHDDAPERAKFVRPAAPEGRHICKPSCHNPCMILEDEHLRR